MKDMLERMETERARLAFGSQNQAIQLSNDACGFMGHERLTHDCSLNLMFAEQGQRQIVLITTSAQQQNVFYFMEKVTFFVVVFFFYSNAISSIPGDERHLTYSK